MIPASSPAPPEILAAFNAATARSTALRLDMRWYPTLSSTMDVAEQAVEAGAAEGLVIVADEQTQGRGRRGRRWSSPPGGGLYFTFLFRPPIESASGVVLSLITLAAGVAVRDAVGSATGLFPDLKWPNDVMVGRRKLAGILAEGIGLGSASQAVLVGVGINILQTAHPGEIAARATSLEAELGRPVDRALVLESLLVTVPRAYDSLRRGNTDDILRAWRRASPSAEGTLVEWQGPDGPHRGTTSGIDDDGALRVRTSVGIERIVGGEVTW